MRFSSFSICESSPYLDSKSWKKAYNGFALDSVSAFWESLPTAVSKTTLESIEVISSGTPS